MFGGMQEFEVLLDGGCFGRVAQQLIVCHAESRRGVHVLHVPVIDERTGLADQGVDHVTKVNGFLAVAIQAWYALEAFVSVPEFQVILVNTHLQSQAAVFAAY